MSDEVEMVFGDLPEQTRDLLERLGYHDIEDLDEVSDLTLVEYYLPGDVMVKLRNQIGYKTVCNQTYKGFRYQLVCISKGWDTHWTWQLSDRFGSVVHSGGDTGTNTVLQCFWEAGVAYGQTL